MVEPRRADLVVDDVEQRGHAELLERDHARSRSSRRRLG
jgi:hypothetical protein